MASKIILLCVVVCCLLLNDVRGDADSKVRLKLTTKECYDMVRLATAGDRLDLVRLLVQQGCSVNRPTGSNTREPTPLHIGVVNDSLQMVKLLVDLGADLEARANMAKELDRKQVPMCKYLLKDGSSINVEEVTSNSTEA